MEWQDQGVLLSARRHGEGASIIEVFTENHGRHAGLVRGGGSRKNAALFQAGNQLSLSWRARIEDQLGTFTVEIINARSAMLLSSRSKLYAFNALAAMLIKYLPEREPNQRLYTACFDVLERLNSDTQWQHRYCIFELEMLENLGYGIDLTCCAVSGQEFDLTHVSPRSGRAVGRESAKGWEQKLLPFPEFLQRQDYVEISKVEFRQALQLSGFFLEKSIPSTLPGLPEARQRLLAEVLS